LVCQFIAKENFCNVVEKLFHYYKRISSPSFINASFCSTFYRIWFSFLYYNDYK
jgi:hypothetical protein